MQYVMTLKLQAGLDPSSSDVLVEFTQFRADKPMYLQDWDKAAGVYVDGYTQLRTMVRLEVDPELPSVARFTAEDGAVFVHELYSREELKEGLVVGCSIPSLPAFDKDFIVSRYRPEKVK